MNGLNVLRPNAPNGAVSIMERCDWRFRFNSGSLASLLNRLLPSGYRVTKKNGARQGLQVVIESPSGSAMLFSIRDSYSELEPEKGGQTNRSDLESLAGELSKLLGAKCGRALGNRYWWNGAGEAEVTGKLAYQLKFPESVISEQSAQQTIPVSFLIHERVISPYFRFNGPQLARVLNNRFEDLQVVSESFPDNYAYLKLRITVLGPALQNPNFELTVYYEGVTVSAGKSAPFHLVMDKIEQIFGEFSACDTPAMRIYSCRENPLNIWFQVAREIGPALVREMWTSEYEGMQRAALLEVEPTKPAKKASPIASQAMAQEPKKPKVKGKKAAKPAKLKVTVEGKRDDFISAVEKWATNSIGKELKADYGDINMTINSEENSATIIINAANNGNMATLLVGSDGTLLIPMNGTSLGFIGKVQGLLKKASPLFQTVKKNKGKGKRKKETSRSYPNFKLSDLKKLM